MYHTCHIWHRWRWIMEVNGGKCVHDFGLFSPLGFIPWPRPNSCRKGVCRNARFLHGCFDVSYRSWNASSDPGKHSACSLMLRRPWRCTLLRNVRFLHGHILLIESHCTCQPYWICFCCYLWWAKLFVVCTVCMCVAEWVQVFACMWVACIMFEEQHVRHLPLLFMNWFLVNLLFCWQHNNKMRD